MTIKSDTRAQLGELFFEAGLLNIDELCRAVFVANKNSLPLGRVLTMLGLTRHSHLEAALTLQNLVRQNVLAQKLAAHALRLVAVEKKPLAQALHELGWEGDITRDQDNLGTILVDAGILTAKVIEDSRGLSKHIGLPLSRVLVLQGLISNRLLNAAYNAQRLIRNGRLDRGEAIAALSSAALLVEFQSPDGPPVAPRPHFIKLTELLMLSGLLSARDLQIFQSRAAESDEAEDEMSLGEYIVESGMFTPEIIASAMKLQAMVTNFELTPHRAAAVLRLRFSRGLTLKKAMREIAWDTDPYDGSISLYHLLRLSGLVTAYDLRRLGHLPAHQVADQPLEERLLKTGIINRSALDACKRCQLLIKEGFLTAEQAMNVLHHWSWSGEGLTRVLEKLQWSDGSRLPSLRALAFRG